MEKMLFREFYGEIKDVNRDDRSFTHPISDESVDAHGSIIKLDGWKLDRFRSNPIVLFSHDSGSPPVGRSSKIWKSDGRLMARTQFAGMSQMHPFAETIFKLHIDGFIRGWSVGFLPKTREPREDLSDEQKSQLWDPFVYTEQELLEYSSVAIPSNPNAISEARDAGHDVDPLMAWLDQHKQVMEFLSVRGLYIPENIEKESGDHDLIEDVEKLVLEELTCDL